MRLAATARRLVRRAFWLRLHVPLPLTSGLLPLDRVCALHAETGAGARCCSSLSPLLLRLLRPAPAAAALELPPAGSPPPCLQALVLMAYCFLADRAFPRSVLLLYVVLRLPAALRLAPALDRAAAAAATRGWPSSARRGGARAALARSPRHRLARPAGGRLRAPRRRGGRPSGAEAASALAWAAEDLPALLARRRGSTTSSWRRAATPGRARLIDGLAGARPRPHQRPPAPRPVREPDRPHALPLGARPAADRGGARDEWRINRPVKRLLDLVARGAPAPRSPRRCSPSAPLAVRLTSPAAGALSPDARRPRRSARSPSQAAHHARWTPRRSPGRCWRSRAIRG